jgi:hypothetical protein
MQPLDKGHLNDLNIVRLDILVKFRQSLYESRVKSVFNLRHSIGGRKNDKSKREEAFRMGLKYIGGSSLWDATK